MTSDTPLLRDHDGERPQTVAQLPSNSTGRGWLWHPRRQWRLTLKEIRETLYDRRTIITLVIIPVVLYPLLALGFRQYLLTQSILKAPREYRVGISLDRDAAWLGAYLEMENGRSRLDADENRPALTFFQVTDAVQAIASGEVDLVASLTRALDVENIAQEKTLAVDCQVLFNKSIPSAVAAAEYLERLVERANRKFLVARLAAAGVKQRDDPLRVVRHVIEGADLTLEGSLIVVVPLILIMMTSTGAVYPAIDLTAGERERGTLEILIAAPVERFALLAAKYVAVVLVALITATVNLGMMIVTLSSLGMWSLIFGERGFSWLLLLQMFALMPLFACFFASILLAITSFARSFKEAQAYLIPVILVSMVPGFAALMPGMELRGIITVVPLLNIVLLGRDLLSRSVDPAQAWLAVAATVVYALGGLALAARIFGAEAVLYGSQESWGDLWRRPRAGRSAATPAMAAFCLAVVFPVFFLAGGFLANVRDWSIAAQLAIASLATSAVFALLPLLFAVWNRIPLRDGFMLLRPRATGILAAVLLGLSMWTAAHELILLLHQAGLVSISGEHFNRAEELLRRWREAPVALVVLTIGVAPGVCEELFFRGFLLRSLLTKMSAWRAALTSGLLFGAFHLITTDLLAVERFLPSALLGCVLGWLCLRGGSVLVSMLAHSLHNCLLVAAAYYQSWLTKQGIGIQEESHLPTSWLVSAGVMAATATVLLWWGPRSRDKGDPLGTNA